MDKFHKFILIQNLKQMKIQINFWLDLFQPYGTNVSEKQVIL